MEFHIGGMLEWLSKLEAWCGTQPSESRFRGLDHDFAWLRAAIQPQLPGTYAPGKTVEELVRTMKGLPQTRPAQPDPAGEIRAFPHDFVAQMCPSADVPKLPHDALLRIDGVTHKAAGAVKRCDTIFQAVRRSWRPRRTSWRIGNLSRSSSGWPWLLARGVT